MAHVHIREATEGDCKAIHEMLKELAEYQKLPQQMHLTEEVLVADGFGVDRFYHALIAELEDKTKSPIAKMPVGYALFFYAYSTWDGRAAHLEDIYVKEQHRNKGIGTELLRSVAKVICDRGCVRLDLTVLDWNKSSIGYYKHLGAFNMTESEGWHVMRFEKDDLLKISNGTMTTNLSPNESTPKINKSP